LSAALARGNLELKLRGEHAMRHIVLRLALACSILGAGRAAAAPLEAYGKLPTIEQLALSPSGAQMAVVVTNGEDRTVLVKETVAGKTTFVARAGASKVRGVMWAGETHLLVITSVTAAPMYIEGSRREWTQAQSIDLATGKSKILLNDADLGMNTIFNEPVVREVGGTPAVFVEGVSFKQGSRGQLSMFRIDLTNTSSKLVEAGSDAVSGWLVGADGQVVAQELYDARSGRWALRLKDRSGWRTAQSGVALQDPPYLVGLGRDGKSVVYASLGTDRHWAWRELRLDGGADADPTLALEDQTAIRDPGTGQLIGSRVQVGDERRYNFFDPKDAKAWRDAVAAFHGDDLQLVSMSQDRKRFIVRVDSATLGPAYALVDLGGRTATWLGGEYQGLSTDGDVSPKRAIHFKARDGLELNGYLTAPRGAAQKGLPLVVLPHGGPAARDMPGFDWWAQAMASRGYAVLQVNYRGSSGLGAPLLEAGYGEWGRKMQTDLADGVAYLAADGVIDPKRVCIVGASYGGYAALAGATIDQGVYRFAASVGGVADLKRQVSFSEQHGGVGVERYWTHFMGAKDLGDPILAKYSPAKLAENATIPVLLIHGQDDTVVSIEQSRMMADALQRAGKPVELVVLKGDDHWLSRGATRLEMLKAVIAFLEKNNPPH
jgi:dipeptidyl aminopeptidase/acylaminoacyl peptidase